MAAAEAQTERRQKKGGDRGFVSGSRSSKRGQGGSGSSLSESAKWEGAAGRNGNNANQPANEQLTTITEN